MGACPVHKTYKGTRKPHQSNGMEPCKICVGVYVASIAMESRLVHECIKYALEHMPNRDKLSFQDELLGYIQQSYLLENELEAYDV